MFQLHGGPSGVRDSAALSSAVAQPKAGIGDVEFYPTLAAKAAALCYSIVRNHLFVDGNKRVGHAAADLFLRLNGRKLAATVDEGERKILALAAGESSRGELDQWVADCIRPRYEA